jgi:hypothetical protein
MLEGQRMAGARMEAEVRNLKIGGCDSGHGLPIPVSPAGKHSRAQGPLANPFDLAALQRSIGLPE